MKFVLGILAVLALGAYVVFYHSAAVTTYECKGVFKQEYQEPKVTTVFLEYSDYRPWVALWSDSQGSWWMESPGIGTDWVADIKANDRTLIAFKDERLYGSFSILTMHLDTTIFTGRFSGSCEVIER